MGHLEPAGTLDLLPLSSGGKTHPGFLHISDPNHFDFHCVEGCQQNILELHSRLLAAVGTIATAQGHLHGESQDPTITCGVLLTRLWSYKLTDAFLQSPQICRPAMLLSKSCLLWCHHACPVLHLYTRSLSALVSGPHAVHPEFAWLDASSSS